MGRQMTKSLSFSHPPILILSNPENTPARTRALSRLKSDGHAFLTRLSVPLRRSKSQLGLSAISNASAADLMTTTEHILESDRRFELSRYRRRRVQTQCLQASDPRTNLWKESGTSDYTDENYPTTASTTEYREKSTWISGLKSYLSLKRREGRSEKQHKKSKSAPIASQGSAIYQSSITDAALLQNNRSGILVTKQSVKSLSLDGVQNSAPIRIAPKDGYIQRQRSQSCFASKVDNQRNVSCLSSSNINMNSEYLTAREFADMIGIHIVDEDTDEDLAVSERCTTSQMTSGSYEENLKTQNSLFSTPHATVCSTNITGGSFGGHSRSSSTYKKPRIWENEFWKNSEDLEHLPSNLNSIFVSDQDSERVPHGAVQPFPKSKSLQIEHCVHDEAKHRRRDSIPMLATPQAADKLYPNTWTVQNLPAKKISDHEMHKNLIQTAKLAKTGEGRSTVVRKGRFEIIYGSPPGNNLLLSTIYDDRNRPSSPSSPYSTDLSESKSTNSERLTIEWKRKNRNF